MIRLPESFIRNYVDRQVPWGPLGWVTYKRTYARPTEDGGKEEWWQTVRRVIEGNFNLTHSNPTSEIMEEMMLAYDSLFNLAWTPPGRGLWMSGTPYAEEHGDSLINCHFIAVRPYEGSPSFPFRFMMDQAMKGGGVGFSVERKNIQQFPVVRNRVKVNIYCSPNHRDYEVLNADPRDQPLTTGEHSYTMVLDSREGWVYALGSLIDKFFEPYGPKEKTFTFDVSRVRPKGEPIRGFGGISGGPAPLVELLRDVAAVLNRLTGKKMSSVDATDLMNLIGRCVVAGNVRRTAQIALGDAFDAEFRSMKQDQEMLMHHRWASNNSLIYHPDMDYKALAEAIAINGEPGVVNLYVARNYGRLIDGKQENIDGLVEGTNPCGEISLANGEPCNLVEIFPLNCEMQNYDLYKIAQIATRYAKRVTFADYDWKIQREIVQKNRRIGVSISGFQDWVLHNPYTFISKLHNMYRAIKGADLIFSKQLGCAPSVKLTTVKPSGTVSKLVGASEGMHWHYAPYMIRRIRFAANDPLASALERLGYRVEEDVYSPSTVVVEFPVKAISADLPGFKSAGEVPAREQIKAQSLLQTHWADNSVSATITFQEHERSELEELLTLYTPYLKSTSMLPYTGHGYQQAPIEPISKEKYEELVSRLTGRPEDLVLSGDGEYEIVGQEDCAGGSCPIK